MIKTRQAYTNVPTCSNEAELVDVETQFHEMQTIGLDINLVQDDMTNPVIDMITNEMEGFDSVEYIQFEDDAWLNDTASASSDFSYQLQNMPLLIQKVRFRSVFVTSPYFNASDFTKLYVFLFLETRN